MYETEPAEPVEAAEPVEPAAEAAPTEAAEPSIYESEDFTRAVEERSREVAREELGALLEQASQYEEGEERPELDPLGDPTEYQQGLSTMFEKMIDQRLQSILPTVQEFQNQQSQAQIGQMLEKIPAVQEATSLLPEDVREQVNVPRAVENMANGYLPEAEARYGPGPRAVETALRMAADEFNGSLKAAHKAGYEARNAELGRLAGAREPAPAGSPPVPIRDEPEDEMAAVAQYLARNGLE